MLIAHHLFQSFPRHWLGGDSLKRHPSGHDTKYPLLADLKCKDYTALVHEFYYSALVVHF